MKNLIFTFIIIFASLTSCSKKDSTTSDASVKINFDSPNVYLNQSAYLSTNLNKSYTWNFGDSTAQVTSISPSHNYSKAGTFTISISNGNNILASKKIRVYPGTCSFQFKNSFRVSMYASAQIYKSGTDNERIIPDITLDTIHVGQTTDTLFATIPQDLVYNPNISLFLSYKNVYSKTINFTTVNFIAYKNVHSVYEITGETTGTYGYLVNNTYISSFGTLDYTTDIR